MEGTRRIGTVAFIAPERGFWFVVSKGDRIFCHVANWSDTEVEMPKVGDRISFELGPGRTPNRPQQAIRMLMHSAGLLPDTTPGLNALAAAPTPEVQQ